jgi:chromosome segregation protein
MTAPARLLALRLQGFKSFGERILVEFGPGISAVVGPNGAGKSNLADALRWALGEQGKALRLRRSEDVIFAGSEKRSALGMADVTLVFGNEDRLLPIDFETVELGRRLFRSGENDYLLNKQRVRLKDLVDLLDAAHLADNAFLFIGQGMVDQALALRPEERRPLFEEVAGVRRHERRKKKAEEQLLEAEANLARVEDVLAELRPQARRLAAQAEQQASRQSAGREYGLAIIAGAHARWHETELRSRESLGALAATKSEAEAAMTALREAEESAAGHARDLASGSQAESEKRAAHEAARLVLTELQLRDARALSDLASAQRDRARMEREMAAAQESLARQRHTLAAPVPARDLALSAAVAEAERALAEALEELSSIRAARKAEGEALAALRRVEAARSAELETARRRLADAERQATDGRATAEEASRRLADAEKAAAEPGRALEAALATEKRAVAEREAARAALDEAEGVRQATSERSAAAGGRLAVMRGRLEALQARLSEEESRGIARAARKLGARPLSDGMEIEAGFRVAVEAALGEAVRGYVVGRDLVAGLEGQRGTLVLEAGERGQVRRRERDSGRDRSAEAGEAAVTAARGSGGGRVGDALRIDPSGSAARLLEHAVWVPDMAAALSVQPALPLGWVVVTRDGAVVSSAGVVTLGRGESHLERRAEVERLVDEVAGAAAEAEVERQAAAAAAAAASAARATLDAAREAERRAAGERRAAEDAERRAGRALETVSRESAWRASQVARLEADRERLLEMVRVQSTAAEARSGGAAGESRDAASGAAVGAMGYATDRAASGGDERADAARQWEARAEALRARRDQLASEEAALDSVRREAEAARARASAAAALEEERIAGLDRQAAELGSRDQAITAEREKLGEELVAAGLREASLRKELEELRAAAAAGRTRLAEAESAAANARERLRAAQERMRRAEVAELEARLALDAIRDQVLVELAGLGDLGARLLAGETAMEPLGLGAEAAELGLPGASDGGPSGVDAEADAGGELEELLAQAARRWAAASPPEAPTPAKLASLRRRFHDLGAANPFAAEEYQAVKVRLDGLEAQRNDLTSAITKTRTLIEQLNTMIATQFRSTFAALEAAFDARFRQLFSGGFARLSLTEPDDLAATGIEIVARPPGKKAQPLSMLSGGERALTAVALLFSMLEVHPVPFCVLDEVDAALDEANVGRFADALRSLCVHTQFIVITHNRGTIEAADALYGVTVGEDAVSRVISLRLEEAQELADRVAAGSGAG